MATELSTMLEKIEIPWACNTDGRNVDDCRVSEIAFFGLTSLLRIIADIFPLHYRRGMLD